MNRESLTVLFLVTIMSSEIALAEALPQWDLKKVCKEDGAPRACIAFEQNAYSQIAGPWETFPAKIQNVCLNEINNFRQKSYRILRACLKEQVFQAHRAAQRSRLPE